MLYELLRKRIEVLRDIITSIDAGMDVEGNYVPYDMLKQEYQCASQLLWLMDVENKTITKNRENANTQND